MEKDAISKKIVDLLEEIKKALKEKRFRSIRRLAREIVFLGVSFDQADAILLGKFIQDLFEDLTFIEMRNLPFRATANLHPSVEKGDIENVSDTACEFLKIVTSSYPLSETNIWKVYESMRKTRATISKYREKYYKLGIQRVGPTFWDEE